MAAMLAAWVATTGLGACPAAAATGQAPERGETVRERPREAYDDIGFRAGVFLLLPHIESGVRYEDNVYRQEVGEDEDFVFFVRPGIRAVSQWSNHAVSLDAGVEADFFDSHKDENSTDWFVTAAGRLDVTRDARVYADLGLRKSHEDRGDPDSASVGEPVAYDVWVMSVGGSTRFNRLALAAEGRSTGISYDLASQRDRDRRRNELMLRAGWEIVPEYEAFVRAIWDKREYKRRQGRFNRNSDGFGIVAGAALDLGGLVFGEVSAGFRRQDYEDSALPAIDGPALDAKLVWNPTPLTTVNGFVQRTVEESVLSASGFLATSGGIGVDHELLRNFILNVNLDLANNRYEPIAGSPRRKDDVIGAGIEATWLVNRLLHVNLGYRFERRHSTAAGGDYDNNAVTLAARLQY